MVKQKKILVTGAAGFIGSHLSQRLLDTGHSVIGIDNFLKNYAISTKKENIESLKKNSYFLFYPVNILENDNLEKIFRLHKPDVVIHLAARAGVRPSLQYPQEYFQTNVNGTINVLDSVKKHNVSQLIFASSSSVYGNNFKVPFSEEDSTDNPISPYGASKKAAEILCTTYAHLYKINTTIFRFFSVYGPGGRPDMAPYIFAKCILENKPIHIFGDSIRRDYTYIDDIVNGIISGIKNPFRCEIINLGNSSPISLETLIGHLGLSFSKKCKIKKELLAHGDVNITFANIAKAKRMLKWEPQVNSAIGLQKFANWMKTYHAAQKSK